jgi:uncharacterized protein YfaS (alpha-2-macroglobulin family)
MGKHKFLLSGIIFFYPVLLFAQNDFSAKTWHFIDTSITKKAKLDDLLSIVNTIKIKADQEQKYFYSARCLNYRMLIADLRTEDTFYFKNSAFIDTLLQETGLNNTMRYSLHLMQAYRIINFKSRYKKFQQGRYERRDLPINYAAFANDGLDSISQLHFEKAKALSGQISGANINEVLWLSSDPLQFLYKPDMYDIAMAGQIEAVSKKHYFHAGAMLFLKKSIGLSPVDFVTSLDSIGGSNNNTFMELKLYRDWLMYHQSNPSVYYFIESLARKYVYDLVKSNYTDVEKIYETYLKKISISPYGAVRAFGVYQLCLLLNSQGKKYFPSNSYDFDSYGERNDYDTAFRYLPAKALQLLQQNQNVLDSFAYLKNILRQMEEQIRRSDLQLTVQEYNLPGEPILAELKFKNTEKIFYKIVKLNANDVFSFNKPQELIVKLMRMSAFSENLLSLPKTDDYNYHNTYLKLDALPAGTYKLVFANKKLTDSTALIQFLSFNVTTIAVINNDSRIYILNRKTGFPLTGTKIKAGYTKTIKKDSSTIKKYVSENHIVNKNGYIVLRDKSITNLEVYYQSDTAFEQINIVDTDKPDDIYSKDDYDGLVEFYEDNAKAYIYTDRSIYRPGQTVHYKAIFITKNKQTGESMVMNQQNLKGKLFGSVYKKWLKEEDPWLFITDPFSREMDSLRITPNEFGSVSGSFRIPKTAATGEWEIEPDYIEKDWQYGTFKVEEYKRPSYEVTIEKPKKELRINDDFSFKVKIKSFAGAMLNNVKVNYLVQRSGILPVFDSIQMRNVNSNLEAILFDSVGYTNAEGELEVIVTDTFLKKQLLADSLQWNFNYDISAEVIDATGESYTQDANITVSSDPIRIKLLLNSKYNRSSLPRLSITAEDKNAGVVNKNVKLRFYNIAADEKLLYGDRKLTKADEWIYDREILAQWFPFVKFNTKNELPTKKLILETTIKTGETEKFKISADQFVAGNYIVEASCEENGKQVGVLNKNFTVFDVEGKNLPEKTWRFFHLPYNSISAGDTITYYSGSSVGETFSILHSAYYSGKKKTDIKHFYEEKISSNGIFQYKIKVPASAASQLQLTQICIINNQVFTYKERIYITRNNVKGEPEIIIEKYRKKLSPGSKEEFSVSIKTKNENIAAELMTTMYDATLDKLEGHKWERPFPESYRSIRTEWQEKINSVNSSSNNLPFNIESALIIPGHSSIQPLWWVNPIDYAYTEIMGDWNSNVRMRNYVGLGLDMNPGSGYLLSGRTAGVTISNASGLDEVVVTGVSTSVRKNLTASATSIQMRGLSSLAGTAQPLIILDGVVYDGDLSKIDPALITQAMVLKGADASALYGSRASQGVLVLSTKGDIIFPKETEPIITTRKNFNESAFFFPAIYADKNGYFSFSFTLPESVTEWNWKMLAHTKLAEFVYTERNLNTQLPLMVQPNMPRLLYQGDKFVLQNRITNLDSLPITGKIVCRIEDAVTGSDITTQFLSISQHDFAVEKKANASRAFEIKIPVEQLNPLKIIVTVRSENFMDGEEHLLPVLSPKIFVRNGIPFSFQNSPDTILQLPSLPNDAEMHGMSLSILPKPQAALINSLPWLANYPYGCAEQTFNKLLAQVIAIKIMRTDKMAQQIFETAKKNMESENRGSQKLPDELSEETMPWLNKINKSSLQQKQLFNLLDTSKANSVIDGLLQDLYKFQNSDGGLAWFKDGNSNYYITSYVLTGFGRIEKDDLFTPTGQGNSQYKRFIQNLVMYSDREFANLEDIKSSSLVYNVLARSYWQNLLPIADSIKIKILAYLNTEWENADKKSLYNQSLLAIASFRYANEKNKLFSRASEHLNSILQLAIKDEQNGIRWKDLADEDDLSISSEETITFLAEAFMEQGNDEAVRSGILKWLLTARNDDSWGSTKATAAAITLLLKTSTSSMGQTQAINLSVDDKKATRVDDDLLKGSTYGFFSANSLPALVQLKKETNGIASGNFNWYYFTSGSYLNNPNKAIRLSKAFYKWDEKENIWILISGNVELKIADRVKVILTIVSSKSLPYVFIEDKRAAAFEPLNGNSGYEYASGFGYYKSTRDIGYQFFAEKIPSGTHEISYEVKVSQVGSFTSGPASLQCMYKPEISAYSNSSKIFTAH